MGVGVKVKVWGDFALFSRPEMKVERCSYDVMTPSAARGILEAIYWHPGMKWVIDKIYVKNPIRFTSVRRNEVKSKVSASNVLQVYNGAKKALCISTKEEIVQRASLLLCDVCYIIEAHFVMTENANATDNPGKFKDIVMRLFLTHGSHTSLLLIRSASRLRIDERICLSISYLACTGFSISGLCSPHVSPQFCLLKVQEFQPVVHRLRLSTWP